MTSPSDGKSVCPTCGTPGRVRFAATDRNRQVTVEQFHYANCPACTLWFLVDPPEDLGRYYEDDYYQTPSRQQLTKAAARERYQLELLLKAVEPAGHLVEIGAAWGVFATQARDAGFDVHAIEMDSRCCRYLRDVVGVAATCSSQPDVALAGMPPSRAIVMWQVLEHLSEPLAVLDAVGSNLEHGGVLVIATPNPDSLGLRLMANRWPHLDAPRHLTLIPPDLLRRWAKDRGLHEVFVVDSDLGARRWNRFAWQRLMLNRCRSRAAVPALLALGAVVSAAVSPWETQPGRGSSYTAVFRKVAS